MGAGCCPGKPAGEPRLCGSTWEKSTAQRRVISRECCRSTWYSSPSCVVSFIFPPRWVLYILMLPSGLFKVCILTACSLQTEKEMEVLEDEIQGTLCSAVYFTSLFVPPLMPKRFPFPSPSVRRAEIGLEIWKWISVSLAPGNVKAGAMRWPNYLNSPWQPLVFIFLPVQSEVKQVLHGCQNKHSFYFFSS